MLVVWLANANGVLVYASKHGSTAGVAERIAAKLRERGNHVSPHTVDQVDDLHPYDGVVFGSAVYDGAWLPEGEEFVHGNVYALAGRPV